MATRRRLLVVRPDASLKASSLANQSCDVLERCSGAAPVRWCGTGMKECTQEPARCMPSLHRRAALAAHAGTTAKRGLENSSGGSHRRQAAPSRPALPCAALARPRTPASPTFNFKFQITKRFGQNFRSKLIGTQTLNNFYKRRAQGSLAGSLGSRFQGSWLLGAEGLGLKGFGFRDGLQGDVFLLHDVLQF